MADDEPTFLEATATLLRKEGYVVDTVRDAAGAVQAIAEAAYDLLLTDLEMPGNADLDLVRQVAHLSGGLPVIVITGFPSVRSAVAAIDLPVTAYLVKPVHFPELLQRVSQAVARFRSYQAMQRTEARLRLARPEADPPMPADRGTGVDTFLTLTLRNVMGSLTDLEQLGRALTTQTPATGAHPCQLINCPRGAQLRQAVEETIAVLEETKGSFKSKALGDLRARLELLLKHG
jgi:CheY-like chemotaxis protein